MERRNGGWDERKRKTKQKRIHNIICIEVYLQGCMNQKGRQYTQVCYLGLLQVVHNPLHEGGVVPTCYSDGCRLVSVCPKQASYFVFQTTGVS